MSTPTISIAAPKYRRRASTGSVSFYKATLKMASLGTTSIGDNVSLQRALAQRIPSIAFSNIGAPARAQPAFTANVPRSIDIGSIPKPTQIASAKALADVGEGLRRRLNESVFNRNAALGAGAIGGFNVGAPARTGTPPAFGTFPTP